MAQQTINLGTPNNEDGDFVRSAFSKTQDNFTELYNRTRSFLELTDVNDNTFVGKNGYVPLVTSESGLTFTELAPVAISNDYKDLDNLPSIIIQDNIAKVINVYKADLSGEGTLEEQIVEYINSLNYEKLETDAEIWINYVSTSVLTAFLVSISSGDGCSNVNLSPYNLTLYHDGSNVYPEIGDTIYIDEEGDDIFITTGDKQMDNLEYLRTNNLGERVIINCE